MHRLNAFLTAADAMENAKQALKPAIVDLASTDEDFFLTQVIKQFLQLQQQATRFHKLAHDFDPRAER